MGLSATQASEILKIVAKFQDGPKALLVIMGFFSKDKQIRALADLVSNVTEGLIRFESFVVEVNETITDQGAEQILMGLKGVIDEPDSGADRREAIMSSVWMLARHTLYSMGLDSVMSPVDFMRITEGWRNLLRELAFGADASIDIFSRMGSQEFLTEAEAKAIRARVDAEFGEGSKFWFPLRIEQQEANA